MDWQSIMMIAGGIGLAAGGYMGGRKTAMVENSQMASETITMLTTQIDLLKDANAALEGRLVTQDERIKVLESLVTQKAEVAQVLQIVTEIRERQGA